MGLAGRRSARRGRLDLSVAAVVFTVPETRLREMAIATGPCVPMGGRARPLVGPMRQAGGEQPEHTAALHVALTGRPAPEALVVVEREHRGTLHVCSAAHVLRSGPKGTSASSR